MRRSGLGLVQVTGQDATRTQVVTLLTTEPGDLLIDSDQGLAVDDLLLIEGRAIVGVIEQRIRDQFARYMPTVVLDELRVQQDDERVEMVVVYRDMQTGESDQVQVAR